MKIACSSTYGRRKTRDAQLPVLFWIHGGGFTGGSAVEQQAGVVLYDGQRLSEKTHSVVVTTNYRLGVLGFFAHAALAGEADDGTTGNYGMLDQIAAFVSCRRTRERLAAIRLSESIEAYWSSFAETSAPSAPSSPAWTPSDAADT